jgi:hypothetical protein
MVSSGWRTAKTAPMAVCLFRTLMSRHTMNTEASAKTTRHPVSHPAGTAAVNLQQVRLLLTIEDW